MKFIDRSVVENSMSYAAYRKLVNDLMAEGKTTGGPQTEAMLNYTRMSVQRMDRWDKRVKLADDTLEKLKALNRKYLWLVISEGWCGDASQIVPVMNKMAEQSDHIDLRLILRDENLEVMDAFLTNGGRSIPKLIVLDAETLEVLCSWGPRPAELQEMVVNGRAAALANDNEEERKEMLAKIQLDLHGFYAKDKSKRIQEELSAFVCEEMGKV